MTQTPTALLLAVRTAVPSLLALLCVVMTPWHDSSLRTIAPRGPGHPVHLSPSGSGSRR